jgi:hypothetical protein
MEHKLIMENWRKFVNEQAIDERGAALSAMGKGASGAGAVTADSVLEIAKIFVAELAEVFSKAATKAISSPGSTLPGVNPSASLGGGTRFARRIGAALGRANLLGKLKIFLKEPKAAQYLITRIGSLAVAKGLARAIPPVMIALEIYEIVSLWNRETKGVNTWGLALDAIKGSHAMAKDNPGHEEAVRYTTENFDKWDEETQVGWCVKHGDAPEDFEGQLTCQTVLQKADPKLIQKAKTTQGKGSAGKTDADTPMSVPTS